MGFVLPILYLIVTLLLSIKGIPYSNGTNFPYYFLDYHTLGWFNLSGSMPGVAWWILIVAGIALSVSFVLAIIKHILQKI